MIICLNMPEPKRSQKKKAHNCVKSGAIQTGNTKPNKEIKKMNALCKPTDIKTMPAITQELDALLTARGYALHEARRMDISAINGLLINRIEYRRDGEGLILTVQEKQKAKRGKTE